MRKLLRIAWHTYSQRAGQRWFLSMYFGFPILYALLVVCFLLFLGYALRGDQRPLGVVDLDGFIHTWPTAAKGDVAFRTFAEAERAHQALTRGEIQAYYLLGPDYLTTGQITEVAARPVAPGPRAQLERLLRDQLLAQTPPERRERLEREQTGFLPHRTFDATDFSLQHTIKSGLVWGVFGAFILLSMLTTTFLMNSLTEEHSNRTAEILLTSVSAEQLLAGKIVGVVALGLTPVLAWGGALALVSPFILRALSDQGMELAVRIPWSFAALCLALALPAYMFNALAATLAGAVVGITGQGYRVVMFITSGLPSLLWMPVAIIAGQAPDAPLSLFFSLLPFTAPIALPMRAAVIVVPPWQIALSLIGLYLTLVVSLRYSARLYRAAWLMAGHSHRLSALWQTLRGK